MRGRVLVDNLAAALPCRTTRSAVPIASRLAYQSCTSTLVSGSPATSHASRPPRYQ